MLPLLQAARLGILPRSHFREKRQRNEGTPSPSGKGRKSSATGLQTAFDYLLEIRIVLRVKALMCYW